MNSVNNIRFDVYAYESVWGIEWSRDNNTTGSYLACETLRELIIDMRNMGLSGEAILQIIEQGLE